jgi:hypothetical protein
MLFKNEIIKEKPGFSEKPMESCWRIYYEYKFDVNNFYEMGHMYQKISQELYCIQISLN